ncbi:MAG: MBL fold metallo-hydrolase [Oscillospiraceae bacterium]|nr:MBL fold metallo-hydrolase [Oscillospiraceae bacterium]
MTLKYYGTSAAEGFPGMFCTCPICNRARQAGGRNIRTRSQALVDGKLLIDFPPDTYLHVLNYGLDLPNIDAMILTHAHSDHLFEHDFGNRRNGFCYWGERYTYHPTPFRVYASAASRKHAETDENKGIAAETNALAFYTVTPFEPFQVDDFTVTGLKANHAPDLEPLIYLIEHNGKTMLYANDTGIFPQETWDYLAKNKPMLGFASLDCTTIALNSTHGHMGFESNCTVKKRLIEIGCADEKTIFCSHHFSHNGLLTYDELVPIAAEHGFLVSYDGMEITF